ncbi:hypothetical protein R4Z09_18050 [Niallia oryzisoli]|uniref:Nuclear transport factor 2 family protein n=1 Tax=Niallia oryzisoli TaxID=1737571 RepID=A0ABZ2C6S3_9BACI
MDTNYNDERDIKILCRQDCGNAPKKIILKDFVIASVKKEISFIAETISDNIQWNIIGYNKFQGKESVIEMLQQMSSRRMLEVEIKTIITHGNTGAVDGKATYENNEKYAFCHIFLFTSAGKNGKINEITSYVIKS